jgi:hypothetical protein
MTFILEAPRYGADRQRWNQPESVRRSVMFSVISLVPHQFARLRKVRFEEQRVGAGTAHQNAAIVADSGGAWSGQRTKGNDAGSDMYVLCMQRGKQRMTFKLLDVHKSRHDPPQYLKPSDVSSPSLCCNKEWRRTGDVSADRSPRAGRAHLSAPRGIVMGFFDWGSLRPRSIKGIRFACHVRKPRFGFVY